MHLLILPLFCFKIKLLQLFLIGCLDPDKFNKFKLVLRTPLSHNVAKFRFLLPAPLSALGLPIGQHISCRFVFIIFLFNSWMKPVPYFNFTEVASTIPKFIQLFLWSYCMILAYGSVVHHETLSSDIICSILQRKRQSWWRSCQAIYSNNIGYWFGILWFGYKGYISLAFFSQYLSITLGLFIMGILFFFYIALVNI